MDLIRLLQIHGDLNMPEHGGCGAECASSVSQVLSIGETVMEVNDSGFSGTVETLRIQLLVDDSMLQVRQRPSCMAAQAHPSFVMPSSCRAA